MGLAEKELSIHRRIEELEDEITSTPAAIKSSVAKHPFLGLAGAAVAGVAVGLLVTGRRRRKRNMVPFHQRLVEQYIDAVGEDVAYRTRRGRTSEEAVREAMEDRAPLVVYAPIRSVERESKGFFSQLADIAFKTAIAFALKVAIDVVTANVDVEDMRELIPPKKESDGNGEAGIPHTGDGATGTVDAADVG